MKDKAINSYLLSWPNIIFGKKEVMSLSINWGGFQTGECNCTL